MVCKVPKDLNLGEVELYEQAQFKFIASAYCFQLARHFRELFQDDDSIPPIFYATPYLYRLKTPFQGTSFVYAEPNLDF